MIYESIKMVFKVFKTNKMRTFLTMLGIIIGIFSITIIFAISSATNESISKSLSSFDTSMIQVFVYGTFIDDEQVISIPSYEISNLKNEDCIEAVLENKNYTYKEMEKKFEKQDGMVEIPQCTGVNYEYLNNLKITEGRKFTKLDDDNRMPFCIVQESAAETILGRTDNLIGETIKINNYDFEIIGTFSESIQSMFSYAGKTVYVLNSFAKDHFQESGNSMGGLSFNVKPISSDVRDEAEEVVRNKLLEYMDSDEFQVVGNYSEAIANEAKTITGIIELVFAGIAGLSLVVGGIGIMNIMLVSVNERIKEIGIRMALGANSGNIKMQFLIEGVMLTLISGIIGMILASGAISIVNSFISSMEQFKDSGFALGVNLSVMIKTVLFCGVIGIIFGLYPAKKAAELNPIDALRYE